MSNVCSRALGFAPAVVFLMCAGVVGADAPDCVPQALLEPPTWHSTAAAMDGGCARVPGGVSEARGIYGFSGEFYETAVDMRIRGRGFDFVWMRKYRSRIGPDSRQGNGWDFSYNLFLLEDCRPAIVVHDGNSRRDLYDLQPGTLTWGANGFFRLLTEVGPPGYRLTFGDTSSWKFFPFDDSAAEGRIREIGDRNNNTMRFTYDVLGRLIQIRDTLDTPSNPRVITVAYNSQGYIASITDFTGRVVQYEYYQDGDAGGAAGDLKSVTSPAVMGTPNGNDFTNGKTTRYTYTTGFSDSRLNHNLLTITDPKEKVFLQNTYTATLNPNDPLFDRVVRQHLGDPVQAGDSITFVYASQTPGPANNGAVTSNHVTDRNGNQREYFYDAGNRLVLKREFTRGLRPGEPAHFETRWSYNANSLPTQIVYPNGNSVLNIYEPDLNPTAAQTARGNLRESHRTAGPLGGDQAAISEFFEYQAGLGCCGGNFVTRHVDGRGNETTHMYDANGNRLHTQHRLSGIVENFEYNGFGQMTAHELPANGSGIRRRDEFVYHPAGAQTGYLAEEIVDAAGLRLTTRYQYDARGNVLRRMSPNADDPNAANPGNPPAHESIFVYNALDQVVRQTSRRVSAGLPVRFSSDTWYDANDNVVRVDVENVPAGAVLPDSANPALTTITEYEILNRPLRTFVERGAANLGSAVTDPSGIPDPTQFIRTRFVYDGNRNVIRQVPGEAENGNQPLNVTTTQYDERDLVFRTTRAPADPQRSTTQMDYDGNRNTVVVRSGLEAPGTPGDGQVRASVSVYDGHNRVVRGTDPMGNATIYQYDANSNRTQQSVEGELVDVPGGAGNVRLAETVYQYDVMDRLERTETAHFDTITQAPIGDGLSTNQTRYAPNSQVVEVEDDSGHTTRTFYDTANRRAALEDPKLNRTEFQYDANSNVIRTTERELSDLGNPPQVFETRFEYDGLDRQIRTTDNIGNVTRYEYDSRGNQVRLIDAALNQSRTDYDSVDRPIREVRDLDGDGADGAAFADPDIVNAKLWDDNGRLGARTDDSQNDTTERFDALDRPMVVDYADCPNQTREFDVHGNLLRECQQTGTRVEYQYDQLNRVIDKQVFLGAAAAPCPAPDAPQNVSNDTTFELFQYDGLSRLVLAADDDALVTRRYDSLSNVVEENLNGYVTLSSYDGEGRRQACLYPSGRLVVWTYDALDRIQTVSDNLLGLIATYFYIGPSRVERRALNANGTRCDYTYDGQPGTQPPGDLGVRQIVRTRHTSGPLASPLVLDEREYLWDAVGNKTMRRNVTPVSPQHQYAHTYSYDQAYRLVRTKIENALRAVVRDTDYVLDGVGNRDSVGLAPDAVAPLDSGGYSMQELCNPADEEMNQYTSTSFDGRVYDHNGNLSQALVALAAIQGDMNCDGAVSVSDIAGFVLALTNPAAYATTAPGCDMLRADVNGDSQVSVADIGPFVALLTSDGVANGGGGRVPADIRYDYANRMVSFASGGQRHLYRYDALGRRIEKIVDADGAAGGPFATRFVLDGWREIEERDGAGSAGGPDGPGALLASYVFGRYIDEALTMRRDADGAGPNPAFELYYHADDMYNVMTLSDAAGTVVERYEHDDYGRPLHPLTLAPLPAGSDPSALLNPLLFNGRRYEPETTLYYYRTRYLDPRAGRFTTRDTIGIWGDLTSAGNAYTYLGSNPLSGVDPMGEMLVAIDGTGSRAWSQDKAFTIDGFNQSHVSNFWDDYDGLKYFRHGPDALRAAPAGKESMERHVDATKWLCKNWCKTREDIDMVGHSRGGYVVLKMAQYLEQEGCNCDGTVVKPVPVRFLGLYDAVDMTTGYLKGSNTIPKNVKSAVVMLRHPEGKSRNGATSLKGWGWAYDQTKRDGVHDAVVWGTHGGIGGAPWTGEWESTDESKITRESDIEAAKLVDMDMRERARKAGVPIQVRDKSYYKYK